MFKILKGVSVNGGVPGVFAGGGIYNMSCTLGSSGEPTKVTLNIVAENESAYQTIYPNVTSGGVHHITVSDGSSFFNIHRLYPYKYTKNESGKSPESCVGEGIARRERGVRY